MLGMSVVGTTEVFEALLSLLEQPRSPFEDDSCFLEALTLVRVGARAVGTESTDHMLMEEFARIGIWQIGALSQNGSEEM